MHLEEGWGAALQLACQVVCSAACARMHVDCVRQRGHCSFDGLACYGVSMIVVELEHASAAHLVLRGAPCSAR